MKRVVCAWTSAIVRLKVYSSNGIIRLSSLLKCIWNCDKVNQWLLWFHSFFII